MSDFYLINEYLLSMIYLPSDLSTEYLINEMTLPLGLQSRICNWEKF